MMKPNRIFNDLQTIAGLLQNPPLQDIKQNMKARFRQTLSEYGLVTREAFEIQAQVLARTRAKLEAVERRVAQFEQAFDTSKIN